MILVIALFTVLGLLSVTALLAAISSIENAQSMFVDGRYSEAAAKFQRTYGQ
jgi:hypothetical protein